MKNAPSKVLFQNAQKLINEASKESFKPEEDVNTHRICLNSRQAVENYLKGFLLDNQIQPVEPFTITSLQFQCSELNEAFLDLNLDAFNCRFEANHADDEYCLSVNKVTSCFEAAKKVKDLIEN